jgi:hypothetical protein
MLSSLVTDGFLARHIKVLLGEPYDSLGKGPGRRSEIARLLMAVAISWPTSEKNVASTMPTIPRVIHPRRLPGALPITSRSAMSELLPRRLAQVQWSQRACLAMERARPEQCRVLGVVRHEQCRKRHLVDQRPQLVAELATQACVKRRERFVEQKCRRLRSERACESHALGFASRQRGGHSISQLRDVRFGEPSLCRILPLRRRHRRKTVGYVLPRPHVRKQREGLKDESDTPPMRLHENVALGVEERHASEDDASCSRT